MRQIQIRCSLVAVLFAFSAGTLDAADPNGKSAARPYFTFFIASIERVQEACKTVFESVDRHDLSVSMEDRLKFYRNFAGIDPTQPAGRLTLWDDSETIEVVFLPVGDIEELLKTASFGVGYHSAGTDHYEIERPGSPYHVLVRGGYAFLADATSTIQSLRVTPEQVTRGVRERYDIGVLIDFKQVPIPDRIQYAQKLRRQIEPWLQPQDDEAAESANLRDVLGRLSLQLMERFLIDTNSVSIGARLDPQTRRFRFEIVADIARKTPSAIEIDRWKSVRSEFAAMLSPEVPFGLALNLPLGGLVQSILDKTNRTQPRSDRLEAGLVMVGEEVGRLSIIAALRGDDAVQINEAIPGLLLRLEDAGKLASVSENVDLQRNVVFHSLIPHSSPAALSRFIGNDVEILIGQGKQTAWIGIGHSGKLADQICDAIDRVEESSSDQTPVPLVRANFHAGKLPELALSDLLIPNVDREISRQVFASGEDKFTITLEPLESGIRLRFDAEEGFVRLFGREWIKQAEAFGTP